MSTHGYVQLNGARKGLIEKELSDSKTRKTVIVRSGPILSASIAQSSALHSFSDPSELVFTFCLWVYKRHKSAQKRHAHTHQQRPPSFLGKELLCRSGILMSSAPMMRRHVQIGRQAMPCGIYEKHACQNHNQMTYNGVVFVYVVRRH